MDIVSLIVIVAVAVIAICIIWWLLQQVPLDPMMRKIVTIALVVVIGVLAIVFLLHLGGMATYRLG